MAPAPWRDITALTHLHLDQGDGFCPPVHSPESPGTGPGHVGSGVQGPVEKESATPLTVLVEACRLAS